MNIGDLFEGLGEYRMYSDRLKERDARLQMDKDQLAAQIQGREATVKYQQQIAELQGEKMALEQSAHRREYGFEAPTGPQAWKMTLPGGRGVPGVPYAAKTEHVKGFREIESERAGEQQQWEKIQDILRTTGEADVPGVGRVKSLDYKKWEDEPGRARKALRHRLGLQYEFDEKRLDKLFPKETEAMLDRQEQISKKAVQLEKELAPEVASALQAKLDAFKSLGWTAEDAETLVMYEQPALFAQFKAQERLRRIPSVSQQIISGTGDRGGGAGGGVEGGGAVLPYTLSTGAQVDAATTEGQRAIRGDLQYMGADKDKLQEEMLRLFLSAPAGTYQIAQYAVKKQLGPERAKTISDAMVKYGLTAAHAKEGETDTIVNFVNNVFGVKVKAHKVKDRLRRPKPEPKQQSVALGSTILGRQQ